MATEQGLFAQVVIFCQKDLDHKKIKGRYQEIYVPGAVLNINIMVLF